MLTLPGAAHTHWLVYMLPVASACAGLVFVIDPATRYVLEPYSNEAGVASALVGFVQIKGGAALSLLAMALPAFFVVGHADGLLASAVRVSVQQANQSTNLRSRLMLRLRW